MKQTINIIMAAIMIASMIPGSLANTMTSNTQIRENDLSDQLGLDFYTDLYIYSEPHWLGKNLYWDDENHARVSYETAANKYHKAYVYYEDWLDNSWDDVKLAVWADPESKDIAVQLLSEKTDAPDPVHFVLRFDQKTTVTVTSPTDVKEYAGTTIDITLWDDVRDLPAYDYRVIQIAHEEEPNTIKVCDHNGDGLRNLVDVALLAQYKDTFDVNDDGKHDLTDIVLYVQNYDNDEWCAEQSDQFGDEPETLTVCDHNADGLRNLADVAILAQYKDTFDVNDDGKHDLSDIALYAQNHDNDDWCYEHRDQFGYETDLPDIVVTDIQFIPENPVEGEPVEIKAMIKNIGDATAYHVDRALYEVLYDDGEHTKATSQDEETLTSGEMVFILPGQFYLVSFGSYDFDAGNHKFVVEVDQNNEIEESNEDNNKLSASLYVQEEEEPENLIVKLDQKFTLEQGQSAMVSDWENTQLSVEQINHFCPSDGDNSLCKYRADIKITQANGQEKMIYSYEGSNLKVFDHNIYNLDMTDETVVLMIGKPAPLPGSATISISPAILYVDEGRTANFALTITDTHTTTSNERYVYELKVKDMPFAHSLPEKVELRSGQTMKLTFNVYTWQNNEEYQVKQYDDENAYRFMVATYHDGNLMDRSYAQLNIIEDEEPEQTGVDLSITPTRQIIEEGRVAYYTLTIEDKHTNMGCGNIQYHANGAAGTCAVPIHNYKITFDGDNLHDTLPGSINVQAGQTKRVSFKVWEKTNAAEYTGNSQIRTYPFSVIADHHNSQDDSYDKVSATLQVNGEIPPPDFPDEDEISISLNKGWNLVSIPGSLESFKIGDCANYRKLLGFVYIDSEERYVSLQEAQRILGEEFNEYMGEHAFWVYAYEKCELIITIDEEYQSEDIYLNKGWNLVPITNDMIDQKLDDITQDCKVSSAYFFHPVRQEWTKLGTSAIINDWFLGKGLVMKADSACQLGGGLIPPDMPNE